jgi:hypothetical protein
MNQGENESLEEFEERFYLSYKRSHNCIIYEDSLKLVLLIGVREKLTETLNLISNRDIFQIDYRDIKHIFKNCFISTMKKGRNGKEMVTQYSHPIILTKNEIGGLLEDIETCILHSLAMQVDTLRVKKMKEEVERALAIF